MEQRERALEQLATTGTLSIFLSVLLCFVVLCCPCLCIRVTTVGSKLVGWCWCCCDHCWSWELLRWSSRLYISLTHTHTRRWITLNGNNYYRYTLLYCDTHTATTTVPLVNGKKIISIYEWTVVCLCVAWTFDDDVPFSGVSMGLSELVSRTLKMVLDVKKLL